MVAQTEFIGPRHGGLDRAGVKTRRGDRHPEYVALTAEHEIDFMPNHDFGERHAIFGEQLPSRRGLIGEAAVDLWARRIGERLTDALDKIVPHRGEHATQTRGDAGKTRDKHRRNAELAGDFDRV